MSGGDSRARRASREAEIRLPNNATLKSLPPPQTAQCQTNGEKWISSSDGKRDEGSAGKQV